MIRPMSQVAQEEVQWYWFPRIPLGAITMVFGRAGIGKSTMMYDILARASKGEAFPLSAMRPSAAQAALNSHAVIVGTEDTPERVALVLEKAGANLEHIGIVPQEHLPNPQRSALEQIEWLEQELVNFGASVLYVDNVSEALLAPGTDSNNERSVRAALRPLDALAKRRNIACVLVTHPKKGSAYGPVTEAITGSQAFTNLARSVLYVDAVPYSDQMALAVAKSNYYPAARTNTLGFRVQSQVIGEHDGHEVLGVPSIDWVGIVQYNAQQLATENARAEAERRKDAGYEQD